MVSLGQSVMTGHGKRVVLRPGDSGHRLPTHPEVVEFNRACDRFFQKRGMPTGADYSRHLVHRGFDT